MLNKRDLVICLVLFLLTFFSRIFLVEKYQSHWDGPQYSIAIFNYSFEQQTPAPPGYPLYILIGKFFNFFIHEPHYSLLLESVLFSSIGTVVIYLFGSEIRNRKVGIIASILYFSSPVIYFFGLTAYAYGVSAALLSLVAFCGYRLMKYNTSGYLFGLSYATLLFLRPQDILLTLPLFLFVLFVSTKRARLQALFALLIFTLSWFPFYLQIIGGLDAFNKHVSPLSGSKVPGFSLLHAWNMREILFKGVVLTLGIGIIFPVLWLVLRHPYFLGNIKDKKLLKNKYLLFFIFWILPPLLFNLFIRTDHAGYQLPYLVPLLLLTSLSLTSLLRGKALIVVIFLLFISNLYLFFRDRDPSMSKPYIPTSFHYNEIRKNDLKLSEKINWIKKNTTPEKTVILVGEPDYFRPVMYYFPEYTVFEIAALTTQDKNYSMRIYKAFNFRYELIEAENNIFNPGGNITKIICFSDACSNWVGGKKEVIYLRYGAKLTTLFLNGSIKYNYKSIQIH